MMKWIHRQLDSLAVRLLWPVVAMMIVIVVALTTVVTRTYTETILEQEDAKTMSAFNITAGTVDSLMDTAEALGVNIMQSELVQQYAKGEYAKSVDRILDRQALVNNIDTLLTQNPDVYGLFFVREDGTTFGLLPYRTYFFENDSLTMLSEEVLGQIRSIRRGRTAWVGPVSGQEIYRLANFDKAPESLMMGVSYNRSLDYGTVYSVVLVDTAELQGILNLQSDGRSSIYLVGNNGVMLTASEKSMEFSPEIWTAVEAGGRIGSASVEIGADGRSRISWRRIDSLGWYLVRELPMAEYDRTVSALRAFVLRSAAGVFAVAVCVYLIWLRSFMRNFKSLRLAIRRLSEGRLETRIERPFAIGEFEEIRREFNDMNSELEALIQTTRAMERNQLELELRALQTQLSPHMIFNSITAIRWMATMLGADRVSDMLMELSEMLRPVFRDWSIEWTLGEELQHLRHYSNLLDLRYGNNFSMSVDVPEEMYPLRLPRFTLQPLIENSCEHGGASSAKLHVFVRAWMEAGWATVCVLDNGTGISDKQIDEIQRRLAEGGRTERVGLYSVYNRLRICMGSESRMIVRRPESGGAEVTIRWRMDEAKM